MGYCCECVIQACLSLVQCLGAHSQQRLGLSSSSLLASQGLGATFQGRHCQGCFPLKGLGLLLCSLDLLSPLREPQGPLLRHAWLYSLNCLAAFITNPLIRCAGSHMCTVFMYVPKPAFGCAENKVV